MNRPLTDAEVFAMSAGEALDAAICRGFDSAMRQAMVQGELFSVNIPHSPPIADTITQSPFQWIPSHSVEAVGRTHMDTPGSYRCYIKAEKSPIMVNKRVAISYEDKRQRTKEARKNNNFMVMKAERQVHGDVRSWEESRKLFADRVKPPNNMDEERSKKSG